MVRNLSLKIEDVEFKANLKPFSRDSTYGRMIIEKRTEKGSVLQHVYLTSDGTHLLFPGGIGSSYLDKSGNQVAKIIDVDEEGKEIPKTSSMYKAPINLEKTITIEDYFGYDIERTYVLNSENLEELTLLLLECKILLEKGQLIPKDENIIVVIGKYVPPIMLEASEIKYEEEEEEEETVEEIDFDIW
ncbi:MAG: hypothetical protein ACTSP9_01260 [Promethearchaeota archaeon]